MTSASDSLLVRHADFERRYRAALRHSHFVSFLRFVIPLGAVISIVAVIGYSIFEPFRSMPVSIDIGSLKLDGSAIMMERAEMKGFRNGDRPFEVTASKAIQDIKEPQIVNLTDMRSTVEMPDKTTAKISADTGVYDSQKQILNVKGQVMIETRQYTVRLKSATVDFQSNSVVSKEQVNVAAVGGVIAADEFSAFDNGARILFNGHVRSVFKSSPETPEP